jgi:hypothetical protein
MTDQFLRSSYESDNVPWSKTVARRAIQHAIAQQLKTFYQVPQGSPQKMVMLLMQLNSHHEDE